MSGIFGICQFDDKPVDPCRLDIMRAAMSEWDPDGSDTLLHGPTGFGQMCMFSTPESRYERLPIVDAACGPSLLVTNYQ